MAFYGLVLLWPRSETFDRQGIFGFLDFWLPDLHLVRMSHAHGSSGPQVARAQLIWSAGRVRTALVVRRSRAHGFCGPQVARARI